LFPALPERIRDKKLRYETLAERALNALSAMTI
jgi:methylenetetrahydrofolate--tRNA-(uracil-5-)-methyltransferase